MAVIYWWLRLIITKIPVKADQGITRSPLGYQAWVTIYPKLAIPLKHYICTNPKTQPSSPF